MVRGAADSAVSANRRERQNLINPRVHQPMRLRGKARGGKEARAAAVQASADETVVGKVRDKAAIADKELVCQRP